MSETEGADDHTDSQDQHTEDGELSEEEWREFFESEPVRTDGGRERHRPPRWYRIGSVLFGAVAAVAVVTSALQAVDGALLGGAVAIVAAGVVILASLSVATAGWRLGYRSTREAAPTG